jgi:hypothetical protein
MDISDAQLEARKEQMRAGVMERLRAEGFSEPEVVKRFNPAEPRGSHGEWMHSGTGVSTTSYLMSEHKLSRSKANEAISWARERGVANVVTPSGQKIHVARGAADAPMHPYRVRSGHDEHHEVAIIMRQGSRGKAADRARAERVNPEGGMSPVYAQQLRMNDVRELTPKQRERYQKLRETGVDHGAALSVAKRPKKGAPVQRYGPGFTAGS